MGVEKDPVMARRRLKTELKLARKQARRTQQEVAFAMDWSTAKLMRIEGGEARISQNDLKVLLDYFEVMDEEVRGHLLELARVARAPDPWGEARDIATAGVRRFWSYEASASAIRSYQPLVVPGLLQCEPYARTVLCQLAGVTGTTVDRAWEIRLWRQQLHEQSAPPTMDFVVDEAVIQRRVGGPVVMREQLEHLLELGGKDHISIRVIPFTSGAHAGLRIRPFVHLAFEDAGDGVIYLEGPDEVVSEDPDQTRRYLGFFEEVQNIASSHAETVHLIEAALRQMEDAGRIPTTGTR